MKTEPVATRRRPKPRQRLRRAGEAAAEPAGGRLVAGRVRDGRRRMSNACAVVCTLLGTALVAGGASAFNQVIEREPDSLMRRTRLRPVPDGRLQPVESLVVRDGVCRSPDCSLLAAGVNCSARASRSTTLLTYALVYTPLKRRSSFATVIGAIPGALPPVIGWAAARGDAVAGRLGAVRDRVPLAAAALPRDRVDVPRGLRARRIPDAAGDRARRPQHGAPGGRSTARRCCPSASRRRCSG